VIQFWTGRDRDVVLLKVGAVACARILTARVTREITTLSVGHIPSCGKTKAMSNYRERVYEIARQIPHGRVMTYGQLAEIVDALYPEAYTAQTVGWAMHALGDTDCWLRVINSKGGCSTGKVMVPGNKQQFLLEKEGIEFNEQGRCDLQRYLWIPETAS
jgi:methylated-DNA-protein-cysteine methyltransferase-like protein